ncbi:MAG: hypothetical protein J7K84_08440, partial [Deltaproteobacteria bacterium]|nr:hypothetical protein [Deltaproteobacteria bacterium]
FACKYQAGETVRHTDKNAGVRCRKKQMPLCNEVDTDSIRFRKKADFRRACVSLRESLKNLFR